MAKEEPEVPCFKMNRVFPDVSPSPPSSTPSPPTPPDRGTPNHAPFRKEEEPEDSLMSSFIQWVKTNATKSTKQKKNTVESPREHLADSLKNTQWDIMIEKDDKRLKVHKKRKAEKSGQKQSKETKAVRGKSGHQMLANPLFKNVHLSRPATPQTQPQGASDIGTIDKNRDKYRVMYLTVRLEQQLQHVRSVLETMMMHDVEEFRIRSMIKIRDALASFKTQLLGIHVNNWNTMKMFPTRADLEEFFGAVEAVCGSVGEVTLEGCEQDPDLPDVMNMCILGGKKCIKDGKIRVGRSKTSPHSTQHVKTLFKNKGENMDKQNAETKTNKTTERKQMLVRGKINNIRCGTSHETTCEDNDVTLFQSGKSTKEAGLQKTISLNMEPKQDNTCSPSNNDADNDAVTQRRVDFNGRRGVVKETSRGFVFDVVSTEAENEKSAAESKRILYKNSKLEQEKGLYPCTTELADSWSDSDGEAEKSLLADNGANWPLINAKQLEIQQKELELNSLMEDIDVLMAQTDIKHGQPVISGMSFEELMLGDRYGGGSTIVTTRPFPATTRPFQATTRPFPASSGKYGDNRGASIVGSSNLVASQKQPLYTVNKGGQSTAITNRHREQNRNKPDEFIDELDKLLNECENVK